MCKRYLVMAMFELAAPKSMPTKGLHKVKCLCKIKMYNACERILFFASCILHFHYLFFLLFNFFSSFYSLPTFYGDNKIYIRTYIHIYLFIVKFVKSAEYS